MAKRFEFGRDVNNGASISLVSNFGVSMLEKYNFTIADTVVYNLYHIMFRTFAIYLRSQRKKEHNKVSFKFLNANGEFRMGATLTYQAPEEDAEEESGNWILAYTFDAEDLEGADIVIDNHMPIFFSIVQSEMYNTMFGNLEGPESAHRLFEGCIDSMLEFLEANSNDGEEVELNMPGVFTAYCGFEEGNRVYSITPGATVKQLVKDDDKLVS